MAEGGLQIVGDGTSEGTKILIDGRPVRGVSEVQWKFNARERKVTLVLEMHDVSLDLKARVDPEVQELVERLTSVVD